MIRGR